MFELQIGQLVKKIKHAIVNGREVQGSVPLESVGQIEALGIPCHELKGELTVKVKFPMGSYLFQYDSIGPVEDLNKVVPWDVCAWKPSKDFLKKLDLDFTGDNEV